MRGRSAQRGASEPLAGRASPGRVVVQHLILSLKLGNPVLDEVTDRDDPAEPTVLDDRHTRLTTKLDSYAEPSGKPMRREYSASGTP